MSVRLRSCTRAVVIILLQFTTACTAISWQPVPLPDPSGPQTDGVAATAINGEVRVTAVDSTRITLRDVVVTRDSVVGWHHLTGATQRAAFPLLAVLSLERRDPGAAGAAGVMGVLVVGMLVMGAVAVGSMLGGMFQ